MTTTLNCRNGKHAITAYKENVYTYSSTRCSSCENKNTNQSDAVLLKNTKYARIWSVSNMTNQGSYLSSQRQAAEKDNFISEFFSPKTESLLKHISNTEWWNQPGIQTHHSQHTVTDKSLLISSKLHTLKMQKYTCEWWRGLMISEAAWMLSQ